MTKQLRKTITNRSEIASEIPPEISGNSYNCLRVANILGITSSHGYSSTIFILRNYTLMVSVRTEGSRKIKDLYQRKPLLLLLWAMR